MPGNVWEFNRGEWTEAYVFLKLLGNGRVYGANSDFEKDDNVYMDIHHILRYDTVGLLRFERDQEANVTASLNDVAFKVVCCDELAEKASLLYSTIRDVTTNQRKFSAHILQAYLEALHFSSPKAPTLPPEAKERYGNKTDIIISSEASTDHTIITEGYSIKSHLGSASTLFNSSSNSGIKYEISGCTEKLMHVINAIPSEKGIFEFIRNHRDLSLTMVSGKCQTFEENLENVDSNFLLFLNALLLVQIEYYEKARSSDVKDIVEKVIELNPLNKAHPEIWYPKKMKDFLYDAFAGLTASKLWDGVRRISGGYIDVDKDGNILYYRAISDDVFSSYLYKNTFIDRPSRGVNKDLAFVTACAYLEDRAPSERELYAAAYKNNRLKPKKGDWGYVYSLNNRYFIDLNFQIRFR